MLPTAASPPASVAASETASAAPASETASPAPASETASPAPASEDPVPPSASALASFDVPASPASPGPASSAAQTFAGEVALRAFAVSTGLSKSAALSSVSAQPASRRWTEGPFAAAPLPVGAAAGPLPSNWVVAAP